MSVEKELIKVAGFLAASLLLRCLCGSLPSSILTPLVAVGGLQFLSLAQAVSSLPPRKAKVDDEAEVVKRILPEVPSVGSMLAGHRHISLSLAGITLVALYFLCLRYRDGSTTLGFTVDYLLRASVAFAMGGVVKLAWQGDSADDESPCACGRACGCSAFDCCPYSQDFWDLPTASAEAVWQCGGDKPCCKRTWRAPLNFRFAVDTRTMRAPRSARGIAEPDPTAAASEKVGSVDKAKAAGQDEGTEKARVGRVHKPFGRRNAPLSRLPREESEEVAVAFPSGSNWPSCPFCKGPARPAVLMFNDLQWINDAAQERRWQAWKEAVTEVARSLPVYRRNMLRIVILEIGCGGNVPTVRHASEGAATQFKDCADVTVIRINPDYPLPDRLHQPTAHLRHLALPVRGLEALECISKHYQELVGPRTVAPEPLSSPPSGLVLEASRSRSRSRSQGGKSSSDEKQNGRNNGKAEEAARKSRGLTPSPRLGPQRMPRAAALACLEKKPWRGGSREDTAPAESRPKPTRRQPTSSAQPISID